jgi:hypothetical protein
VRVLGPILGFVIHIGHADIDDNIGVLHPKASDGEDPILFVS